MVEPPSRQLLQILQEKKLCSRRDLKRCAGRVKRLAADLPAFDSVWLDALVQSRRLTAFQARSIEAGLLDQLVIGRCAVLDRRGHGPTSETFLARLPDGRSQCIIKRVSLPTELKLPVIDRIQDLVQTARRVNHPSLVLPHACSELTEPAETAARGKSDGARSVLVAQTRLAIVSRPVAGVPFSEVLLTRGRFDDFVVLAIARQTLEALAVLHEAGGVHGEITLRNLLLDKHGHAVLVDAGIQPALQPEFQINAFVDPERYDEIAPELIGTGEPATVQSDLYALGCVLWHLLAGRSVWPSGDPLARLSSHQTSRIPDIREIAPETSSALAEAIFWMTEPDPVKRPRRAVEVLTGRDEPLTEEGAARVETPARSSVRVRTSVEKASKAGGPRRVPLGLPGRASRRVLLKLAHTFRRPVSFGRRASNRMIGAGSATVAALLVVLLATATVVALNGRARNLVLASLNFRPDAVASSDNNSTEAPTVATLKPPAIVEPMPLPEPDSLGVIELPEAGPWMAKRIAWPGSRLTIRGPIDQAAQIVVADQPLHVDAAEITLENIELRLRSETKFGDDAASQAQLQRPLSNELPASTTSPQELAVFRSQGLLLKNCGFLSGPSHGGASHVRSGSTSAPDLLAFEWRPLSIDDPLAGRIDVVDCRLIGRYSTLSVAGRHHRVRCVNSLKTDGGPLLLIRDFGRPVEHSVLLQNVTLRESGSVIAAEMRPDGSWQSQLKLALIDSVIDVRADAAGRTEPLLLFRGRSIPAAWHETVTVAGRDSVVPTQMLMAALRGPDGQQRPLRTERLSVNGLHPGQWTFRAPTSESRIDSLIATLSSDLPASARPGLRSMTAAVAASGNP